MKDFNCASKTASAYIRNMT